MENGMCNKADMHGGFHILNDMGVDDILRAPTRKRKTPEAVVRPRVIRMAWDLESTTALMKDIGVSLLASDENDINATGTEVGSKPTPHITAASDVPLGAPKAISSVQSQSQTAMANVMSVKALSTESPFTMSPLMMYIDSEVSTGRPTSTVKNKVAGTSGVVLDPWCLLSDEMILSVFGWLSKATLARCARVCKRWKTLVYDVSLWKSLDLGGKTLKRGVAGHVFERGVYILRLAKTEIQVPIHTLNSTLPHVRSYRVQYLDLSMAAISTQGLEELLSNCYSLRRLSLENCELNNNICRYIGQNQHIDVLNLCMCQGLSENALVPICNNLHKLDSLNIAWTNMSCGAVVYLVISLPATITKLNLSGCRETLQDEDVLQLCGSCPHLSELDLSDSATLTSQSVEHIVQNLPWLRYLALSRCYKVPLHALALLADSRLLEALDVFGMLKEVALSSLAKLLNNRKPNFRLNKCPYSSIARPTTGVDRTKIWGLRTRDRAA